MGQFSMNSSLGQILDDPSARAVIERLAPHVLSHPMLNMARGMSLYEVRPYAQGMIDDATFESIKTELEAL